MTIFDGLPDVFTEALGEPVVYTPSGGLAATINAIEVREGLFADPVGAGVSTASDQVVLHVRTIDVPDLAEGDAFTLPAKLFRPAGNYRAVQPITEDGKGMTAITLERV